MSRQTPLGVRLSWQRAKTLNQWAGIDTKLSVPRSFLKRRKDACSIIDDGNPNDPAAITLVAEYQRAIGAPRRVRTANRVATPAVSSAAIDLTLLRDLRQLASMNGGMDALRQGLEQLEELQID